MRLISLGHAVQAARDTINRFPLAILSAFVATVTAFAMIEGPSDDALPRLLATSILGLALFTASVTSAERRGMAVRHRWVVDVLLVAGLALLCWASQSWTDRMAGLRFVQLLLAGHLLVAIAPYLNAARLDGFWQFNRLLFLRYLTGAFYAGVLWVGLAVALAALDRLFGVHVPGESYGKLWALLAFGFHPWFFLAGVPRDYAGLEERNDYPAGLKVFTQFVLMPLVAVYLLILTAYLAKVMLTRTWPNGWIGYLVSSVATTGVLALLLVHPLRERADNRWVDVYGRWWFVALLPSLGMLLAAIAKRVGQYGMTEPRYFLLVLALWLSALGSRRVLRDQRLAQHQTDSNDPGGGDGVDRGGTLERLCGVAKKPAQPAQPDPRRPRDGACGCGRPRTYRGFAGGSAPAERRAAVSEHDARPQGARPGDGGLRCAGSRLE